MADPSPYDTGYFTDADELGKSTGLGTRDSAKVQKAVAMLEAFAKRGGDGPFHQLQRADVASGLLERVRNPDSMNQGNTWLCGIATVVRTWAFDFPDSFASLGISLYERGYGTMSGEKRFGERKIEPSDALKSSPAGKGVPAGDWIVLASVREAFNDVFNYTANEGVFRIKAWNFPSDVEREFRALGYTMIVNTANGIASAGFDNLMAASDRYDNGWRVILLVNSRLLVKDGPIESAGSINHSNHWIGLNSSITINTFNQRRIVYPFEVYSWNGLIKVPRWDRPLPLETVSESYFGYVAGKY